MRQPSKPIHELIADVIGRGRNIATCANALHLGGTADAAGLARRVLASFARGGGLNESDDAAVDLLLELFEADIARETIGTEIRLTDPVASSEEDCFVWDEVQVLTARGRDLHALLARFRDYVEMRNTVRARLLAEAYMMRQLRG